MQQSEHRVSERLCDGCERHPLPFVAMPSGRRMLEKCGQIFINASILAESEHAVALTCEQEFVWETYRQEVKATLSREDIA